MMLHIHRTARGSGKCCKKGGEVGYLALEIHLICSSIMWAASSEFGTYRLCEQRRFRRACASALSRQNLRCSLIQAVSHEEPSDRKPDPWPLWMAGHAQLKFVKTECSKTQIPLTLPISYMKPKLDKASFTLNSIFLIGQKNDCMDFFFF